MLTQNNSQKMIGQTHDVAVIKSVARYLHHLRTITMIRHTIPVVIASQQHRGAILAYLEGDSSYELKVVELQHQIEHRMATLQLLNQELSKPVAEQEIEQLLQEWFNVKSWSGGPSLENFSLHSHFIEQIMRLVWRVTEKSNFFYVDSVTGRETSDRDPGEALAGDTMLIRFILHETPEIIELIAKIRGLATHASVIGECDAEHASRLEYLLRQLNQKKEQCRVLSKALLKYVLRDFPALVDMQMQDSRIVQLVQLVENKVLRKPNIQLDSQDLFHMATTIINSQTEVVYQGLDFIQNKMHRQFESDNEFD